MDEYIKREAVRQVLLGRANGLVTAEVEALRANDLATLNKIRGAKEQLRQIDNDLDSIPATDVQPIVYAHKTINVGRRSYCSNCGKLAIMEDFCSKCGAKVKDSDAE